MSGVGGEQQGIARCNLDVCVRASRSVTVDDGTTIDEYCSYEHWSMDQRGRSSEQGQGN